MNLKNARILVTNDDGINAQGLKVLEGIARGIAGDVWVVAPEIEQSGASHSLTINDPLRFRKYADQRFSVTGTPTDCVLMAVSVLVPEKIDFILSGVNRGGNTAEDISHSGTVAAAMEGTLLDIPSIAFSQGVDFNASEPEVHWETASAYGGQILALLANQERQPGILYNVNFPDCAPEAVKGIKVVQQGKRSVFKQLTRAVDPKGREYFWLNWADESIDPLHSDSDIRWVHEDYITITPITVHRTDRTLMDKLKPALEKTVLNPSKMSG